MAAEAVELMYFTEFGHQLRRRHAIPQLPTRTMIHFPKGKRHETTPEQVGITQDRRMGQAIKNEMFIYLIRMDNDLRSFHDSLQFAHIFCSENGARRVMRRVEHD